MFFPPKLMKEVGGFKLGYGVIGNTAEFGSAIVGSSPATPTNIKL